MLRFIFLVSLFGLFSCIQHEEFTEVAVADLAIIPQPNTIKSIAGEAFKIDAKTVILHTAESENEAELLQSLIEFRTGLSLALQNGGIANSSAIVLSVANLPDEAYELLLQKDMALVTANTGVGLLHGCQTFVQMLPRGKTAIALPSLRIKDQPKFEHRGLLLDCCRHFWSIEVVKKNIDVLSRYKMNVLHWHLTEDQGWRVEINKYPKLTEIGAWRTEADGSRYGGFYTQAEMREVVEYAKKRHITVIPEIELPGHSLAALAAYPHLACTDGPFEVTHEWGVFKDVYCAGNDSTFLFLENVLTEVMEIFPSKYIHIGGDESPKYRWENCDKCQRRIKTMGLHDEHELQSYFIERIQKFLSRNGRELIGWDEILEGGLAPGALVQSWRGMQGGIDAAKAGNQAIMSPTSHCYLDYGLQKISLEKIYTFDPIPEELNEKEKAFIIGGECNMWTEHVPTEENLDSKILPRMIGLAEVLWSYPEKRDYSEFTARLAQHYPTLGENFDFGFEQIPIGFETEIINHKTIKVHVEKATEDLQAHVAFDTAIPTADSNIWEADSTFSSSTTIAIQAIRNDRPYPELFTLPLSVHQALGVIPKTEQSYSEYYTAGGAMGLTDGVLGTLDFRDGHWQGYSGTSPVFLIDLGAPKKISRLESNFYQYNNAWIFAPKSVTFSASLDGEKYIDIATILPTRNPQEKEQFIANFSTAVKNIGLEEFRYIKVKVESIGPCPDWHDAAGSDSWIFIDELVVF